MAAVVYIPRDERPKLDGKTKQCIFIGYGHEDFGYGLWDPMSKKIIISRDVIFLKDQTIKNFEKIEKSVLVTRSYIDVELEPPFRSSVDGGDVQGDDGNTSDEPPPQPEVPVEQVLPKPLVEP